MSDNFGVFLLPYFLNDKIWNLSFSIYSHLLLVAIFGRSVFLTRAVPAMVVPIAILAYVGIDAVIGVFKSRTSFAILSALATLFLILEVP